MSYLTPVVCYGFPDKIEVPFPEAGIAFINQDREPSVLAEESPVEAPPEGEVFYSFERILKFICTGAGAFEALRHFRIWQEDVPDPIGVSLYFGCRVDYGEPLQTPDTATNPVPKGVPLTGNITISGSPKGVITSIGNSTDYICLQLRIVSPAIPRGSFKIYVSWEELY
jgi:hypothetical protein